MERALRPEILDGLPADDPAARASRRDLWRLNRLLGTPGWFARELSRAPTGQVLELGAGDGQLAAALLRAGCWTARPYLGLDLQPRPRSFPRDLDWQQADLTRLRDLSGARTVLANLVLHHFEPPVLRHLGEALQNGPRLLLICEPLRSRWHRGLARSFLPLLTHPVTQHDAVVSIQAGFRGDELPQLLGLTRPRWEWTVQATWRGAYRLRAVRTDG